MRISSRSQNVKTSPTLALAAKAIELKEKGVKVVSLSVGEPDWETFPKCKEAGIKAIQENKTKYSAASGTNSLKKAVANKFKERFSKDVSSKNVVVTPGAKYAIQQALWTLTNPGDKVGIFVPFWASYTTMVEIAEGVPVLIPSGSSGELLSDEVEKAIQGGVKLFLINSPNNPSGFILQKKDYEALVNLMRKYPDVELIMDDIYSELYWGEESRCPHILDLAPDLFDRILCISGASKAFSMTGWRIGWAVGSENVIKGISKLQSQTTGCPSTVSQEATEAGLLDADEDIKTAVVKLEKRADLGFKLLSEIEGVQVQKPESAFYFWLNLEVLLERFNLTDSEFCTKLLEQEAVVIVPGSDFGVSGYARLSFAVHEDTFAEGVRRLQSFIKSLD